MYFPPPAGQVRSFYHRGLVGRLSTWAQIVWPTCSRSNSEFSDFAVRPADRRWLAHNYQSLIFPRSRSHLGSPSEVSCVAWPYPDTHPNEKEF